MIFYESNSPYDNIKSIEISPYFLQPKFILNAKIESSFKRMGFLLKVDYKDIGIGYADCFAFPELGDSPISEQISYLKNKKLTRNLRKSLIFSRIDAIYRGKNLNAFNNLNLPKNHWTVSDISSLTIKDLFNLKENNFCFLKLKFGRNLQNEINFIKENYFFLKELNLKFRIDFNSSLTFENAIFFFSSLQKYVDIFDFIEDPIPFQCESWNLLLKHFPLLKLALDNNSLEHLEDLTLNEQKKCVRNLIIKPAQQYLNNSYDNSFFSKLDKVIFTSYMDHPLGQVCALYEAANFYSHFPKSQGSCGFLTHFLYVENAYSECLMIENTRLIPSSKGTGFGFNHLLEKENWRNIIEY
ncbi:hypothetical protein [Fluviispira multicolorata]|uniref:OSBS enolase-like N-terminal domain-containing protein n=1 Tax=Fluviispira multicolorata TaxID=2654512 RepID=A0A833JD39_9BACT|nr:hypothetical protein [Fluviispira multicolorata]KAB8031033.1 hypothetical protein GCL57_08690 [Fluviispira multicolorata]